MDTKDRSKELISLLFQEEHLRDRIFPYLDEKYFQNPLHKEIITTYLKEKENRSKFPSAAELRYILHTEEAKKEFDDCLKVHSDVSMDIKKDYIKEWFKTRMMLDTLGEMTEGLEDKGAEFILPYLDSLRDICSFDFDNSIGMDFSNDGNRLFDYIHENTKVVSTGIDVLDKEIGGGWHEKTLSLLIAPSNVGKTLCKCSFATNAFLSGKNVLYVTMEMSEEEISKRIYANVANISMQDLSVVSKEQFLEGYKALIGRTNRLFIKEYPTASASANTLRKLLKDLKMKQKFTPDVIFVDYVGIMQPNHVGTGDNTNVKYKTITEELRGLAVEQQVAVVSSNQTNRGGYGKAEVDLTDTADSIGQVMTADVILTIGQDNEMRDNGRYNFITSKNRFNRRGRVLQLAVDFSRMKVYEETEGDKVDKSVEKMLELTRQTQNENLDKAKIIAGLK